MRNIGSAFVEARIAATAKAFMPKGYKATIRCDDDGNIAVKIKEQKHGKSQKGKEEAHAQEDGKEGVLVTHIN